MIKGTIGHILSQYLSYIYDLLHLLEIECQVVINSPATMVHSKLTELYLTLMNVFYEEATAERMIGKLFNFAMTLPPVITLNKHPVREEKSNILIKQRHQGIACITQTKQKTLKVIVIDENLNVNCFHFFEFI